MNQAVEVVVAAFRGDVPSREKAVAATLTVLAHALEMQDFDAKDLARSPPRPAILAGAELAVLAAAGVDDKEAWEIAIPGLIYLLGRIVR